MPKKTRKKLKPGNTTLFIWNVPIEEKQKFKSKCAQNGTSMQAVIIDFVNNYSK